MASIGVSLRLEHLLRFLEAQRVHVLERRHARGVLKATLERALGEAAQLHHRGDRRGLVVMLGDPVWQRAISASSTWRDRASRANGCWPTACQSMRLMRATCIAASIPMNRAIRYSARSCHDVPPPAITSRWPSPDTTRARSFDLDPGIAAAQDVAIRPVRRCLVPVEQARLGEQHRAGARGCDAWRHWHSNASANRSRR